jgi:hypothetical protein
MLIPIPKRSRCVVGAGALAIVLWAVEAGGQGAVRPLPPTDQQEIAGHLGAGVVGAALPSEALLDASPYFPLQERAFTFQVTSGANAGKVQHLTLHKTRRPSGAEAWRLMLSPSLHAFVNPTGSGDFLMPAVSDIDEGVVVVTTPANPLLLKGMKPGESRRFTQKVSVNYLDHPAKQDYAGKMTGAYTYVGTYRMSVPAGTFDSRAARLPREGRAGARAIHGVVLLRARRGRRRHDQPGGRLGLLDLQRGHNQRESAGGQVMVRPKSHSVRGQVLRVSNRRRGRHVI